MNIYFMYKFSDKKEAVEKIYELRNKGLEVFAFDADENFRGSSWKKIAKAKIKECDCVCYYYNNSSFLNNGTPKNILWEHKTALKYGKKIIFIDGGNSDQDLQSLVEEEKKTLLKQLFNETYGEGLIDYDLNSFESTSTMLDEKSKWKANKVVVQNNPLDDGLDKSHYYSILFDQYKLMVETSESLINRRQTTSNVYVGILTALLSLVGSSLALSNRLVTGIIFLMVGLITIVLSVNWKSILIHYDKNNEGKFAVINAIEERLPANMFDTEYTYNKIKSIVSYASREKRLCKIFAIIGAVIALIGIIILILSGFSIV